MKSVILAGGFGTRIRPLTLSIPKPLIDFCNRPCIEYQIEASKNAGVDHIIIAIFENQNMFNEIKKLEEKYSIKIDLSVEETPLGTAGSLRFAKDLICDPNDESEEFLTFNSDIICNYPLKDLIDSHRKNKAKVTQVDNPKDFGVVVHDDKNKIVSFVEKPKDLISNKINAGVYVLSKEVLEFIPLENYSIEKQFFPKFIKFETSYAYPLHGYWSDIGIPSGYLIAQKMFLTHLSSFYSRNNNHSKGHNDSSNSILTKFGTLLFTPSFELPENHLENQNSTIDFSCSYNSFQFKGSVLIHPTCKIGEGCLIGPNVCLGQNVNIGAGCRILNSTILSGVQIESNSYIENSIIGWNSKIKKWTRIEGLTVLGKDVTINESLFLKGTLVLPHKTISSSIYETGQEIVLFKKNPPPNCKLEVFGRNNNIWIISWTGLEGTIYAGEKYKLKVILPDGYPLKPPIIYFLQPAPVHPHVYSNGDICMSSLGAGYLPSASISSFVLSIISMLSSAKEKRLPLDNHLHADFPPGTSEEGYLYHDDKC